MLQFVKAELPTGEVELDGQGMHVELADCLSCVEYFPVPQSVHATAPVDDLYVPATHAAHGPPFGPVHPEVQVQLVKAALPAGALEFGRQVRHVEFAVAPTAVE